MTDSCECVASPPPSPAHVCRPQKNSLWHIWIYDKTREDFDDDGSDEEHGLGEIWPPVVVANPVALHNEQIQEDGQSTSIKTGQLS